ncbi:LOW QUALITY PROTEIN: hypothetical protein Cgig2_010002 [Carnegiea gigantea]|uniref:Retropepsins domain-containing protein n=1 Tax=Carnegiea gigantea TaxID=171969 RepID=A0A9Q1JWZ0_9CARY|nr:LOW QUALITY PROTEIN: hypothetical protein Cgig2_010002 [Carnegiea gigantea]
MAEQGNRVTVPTMVFGGKQGPHFTSVHNNPLVVEMKVASTILRRILIDMGSSVGIITWDCLKKLTYPGREIIPLVHPILRFEGQEVNSTGIIRLPLRLGDKIKAKNLEVDFLVVNPTLYKMKVVIAPYLLQLQFEADDGSIGTIQGDHVRPLVDRTTEQGPPLTGKKAQTGPSPPAAEALVIHTVTSDEPERALSVRTLTMIAPLIQPGSIALLVRHRNLAIQGCSLLIAQALFNSCRRVRLHQLGVLTLDLSTTAILDELDVRLKITFNAEGLRCQGAPERTRRSHHVPDDSPDPRPWLTFQPRPLPWSKPFPAGALSLLLLLQLLQAVLGCRFIRLLALSLKVANLPPQQAIRALERHQPPGTLCTEPEYVLKALQRPAIGATKESNRGISIRTFLACISTHLRRSSSRTRSASVVTCSTVASPDSRENSFPCACSTLEKRESGQSQKKNLRIKGVLSSLSLDLLRFRSGPFWASTTLAIKEGIDLDVSRRPFLSIGRLPIWVTDRLPLVPIRQMLPTRFAAYEKKVVFSILNFELLLDGRHEAFLIVETIPPEVSRLAGSPLDQLNLRKRKASTS